MSDDYQDDEREKRSGTVEDWTAKPAIREYPTGTFGGQWIPAVEVYVDEPSSDGGWIQKFIVHDGTPGNRFPVDRVGSDRINFVDPKQVLDIWVSLNKGS